MRRAAALIAGLAFAGTVSAATPPPGSLIVTGDDGTEVAMPLRHTRVRIDVSSFVAVAVVEQVFENPFERPVEALYTFPLGDRAAVDEFEMVVGDRTIRGEIRRRAEARREYDAARSAGYQAALLEQERPNVFTQSIANLEPGREIIVRLRTVEALAYEAGTFRLTFPLVVGPRYLPATGLPDPDRIAPPALAPGFRTGHDVELEVTLGAGVPVRALSSPSHRVLVERPSAATARVRLAPGDTIPNKDFILKWNVSADEPEVGLLSHRTGPDGFFTLLVQPKGEVSPVEAAPKEILLVLDTSGSMRGVPLEASKRFVRAALRNLGPRDTFNLIRFAGDATAFSAKPVLGQESDVERAIDWLDGLEGSGGTELLHGLRRAFERSADPDRVRIVVFATDGYIGADAEILASVAAVVGEARIHVLGIGSSVNHALLDRMGEIGRGSYTFIRPDADVASAVERFCSWVTRPYLTDLEIDWGALPVADVTPRRIRDLSSGQTLALVGRYLRGASGEVVLRGKLGGRYWEKRFPVDLPESRERHTGLPSVWARRRIKEHLLANPGDVPPSVEAEVTAIALEHRILSPYTSFIAVDDRRITNPDGTVETIRQPLPLPEGVSYEGVFGARPVRVDLGGTGSSVVVHAEKIAVAPAAGTTRYKARSARGADAAAPPSVVEQRSKADPIARDERADGRGGHLLEASLRVLAEIAADDSLRPSSGRPALEALVNVESADGNASSDVGVQALVTWALLEARIVLPDDPRVAAAAHLALRNLASRSAELDRAPLALRRLAAALERGPSEMKIAAAEARQALRAVSASGSQVSRTLVEAVRGDGLAFVR